MTQKNGNSRVLTAKVYVGMKHIAWNLSLVAQSSSVERRVVPSLVRYLWWDTGIQLERSQLRAGFVGRPKGVLGMFCLVNSRHVLATLRKKSQLEAASGPCAPNEPGLVSSDFGRASEHAVISSFPVSAVGGKSEPAVFSSFSAEVTAPSPSPLRNVTGTPESSGESCGTDYTYCETHVICTPCTGCSLLSRAGVTGYEHQQKETQP